MTNIFVADIVPDITSDKINLLKHYFNESVVARISKSPGEEYKLKRISSRLLLIQVFKALTIPEKKLKNVYYNANGKLICEDVGCNISLSYSGNIAVCLASNKKMGMDVENVQGTPKQHCINLLEKMTQVPVKNKTEFYYLWTQIESIVKLYEDKGLSDIFFGNLLQTKHYTSHCFYNKKFLIATSTDQPVKDTAYIKTMTI